MTKQRKDVEQQPKKEDDESYFWSSQWQDGIHEAMEARAAGKTRIFDSKDPNDVVRWLKSEDDGAPK